MLIGEDSEGMGYGNALVYPIRELREFEGERYLGYCLARRHGAARTMALIRRADACFSSILGCALEEIGERRLVHTLDKSQRDHWAFELLIEFSSALSTRSKGVMARRIALNGDLRDIYDVVADVELTHRQRRPLILRIAKDWRFAEDMLFSFTVEPTLSRREKQILNKAMNDN